MCPSLIGRSIDLSPTVKVAVAGVEVLLGAVEHGDLPFYLESSPALKGRTGAGVRKTDVVQCNITYRIVGLGSSWLRARRAYADCLPIWSANLPRLSSRPSTLNTSKIPGEVARPVSAARKGWAT